MKHAIKDRMRNAQDTIPTLVQLFRRSQIHYARLILKHPSSLIRTNLENLRSFSYGVKLLLHC